MDIKKKHLIVICSAMAAAFSIALIANSQANLIKGDASDVHNGGCNWNHYEKVDATYNHHGSKEFYACCSHPGNISFDRPSQGNIVDMGEFSGDYFDSLLNTDARYIPSLYEGMDLLYDCKDQVFVPQNYTPASHEEKSGLFDSEYGYYSTINVKQLGVDAVWFRVADSFAGISLADYKEIVFYIKSNQTITNFNIRADSWDVVVGDTTIGENVWTKIVVPVTGKTETLRDIAPASWGEKTDLLWSITSLYGVK